MYRAFLHAGKVTDRIDGYSNAADISSDDAAAAEVAAALGVDVSTIEVVHGEDEPPKHDVVIPPMASLPPEPPTPLEIIANAILADAGTSTALKDAARAAIAGGEVASDRVIPMVPKKG